MSLIEIAIRKAKAETKPYKMTDGDGLFLLVKANGGKYGRFKYRVCNKEKLLAFGTYPEESLSEAREKRQNARKLLRDGIDPGAKKQEDRRLAI